MACARLLYPGAIVSVDGRMYIDHDNQLPLAPLPLGDNQPPGGSPPAPPGTGEGRQPDEPERSRNRLEALIYTARVRGFLYKSELVAFLEVADEQAGAIPHLGLWQDMTGTPLRRKEAIKSMSRRLRELGIKVRRGGADQHPHQGTGMMSPRTSRARADSSRDGHIAFPRIRRP